MRLCDNSAYERHPNARYSMLRALMAISDIVPHPEIEQQLARMLRRGRFIRADSPRRLLAFLVDQKLKGITPSEYEIGTNVFNRDRDWIPEDDAIVRVNLTRLKKNLTEYYSHEGRSDAVVIRIFGYMVVPEFRPPSLPGRPPPSGMLERPFLEAREAFFTSPKDVLRCVVTGDAADVGWHHLDGDSYNLSIGNLVPLCGRLRSHIDALEKRRRTTGIPDLDPKRLADKLAPDYFREWKVARAYGCAALAFHMGAPPYGEEPDSLRALRVCDIIHYARHHFFEPLMHQILRQTVLPFLLRIDTIDAVAAVRLSIQLTALLEEAGYYEDAQNALFFADSASRKASPDLFVRGAQDAFTLWRRRAQLFAERTPNDAKFDGLIDRADEHAEGALGRAFNLQIVRAHRWLRQGSSEGLKRTYEMLVPVRTEYRPKLLKNEELIVPPGFAAAELSELLLLSAIAACRLRPGDWKRDCEDAIAFAKELADMSGNVLPAEYERFISSAIKNNHARAAHMLRRSLSQLRPPLRDDARVNVTLILKCLARMRVLKMKAQ
jgi:hypothetical protein